MRKLLNILSLLLLICTVNLQSLDCHAQLKESQVKKLVKKGRSAYNKGEYWKAKSYYDKVTASNTTKPQYWLEAGKVYYDSQIEREKSLEYFKKALEYSGQDGKDTIPEIFYYKAKAHHFVGEYEEAIASYNIFLNNVSNNKKGLARRQEVIREIQVCNNGVDLKGLEQKRYAQVTNMGQKVNSDYPDYAPVVTNDENLILFCSRRPPGQKKSLDGLYYEDIFYTQKRGETWGQADIIDKSSGYINQNVNDGKQHEAPISLSADGKTLFIYKKNSIWKSEKDANGKWGIPRRMNQNVNIGTHNPSVHITNDGTEMFIVSEGAQGGIGGRDIYHTRIKDNGGWEKPVNLGDVINTPFNEDAPFLSSDGKTLYFASTGHNSMGGYDIFKTERDENGNWSKPVNIGAPINSSGDDIYYVENAEGTLAYYASMRPGSFGYLDLYTASFECKNIPSTEVRGYAIFAENHLPVPGVIKVINKETGEEAGTFQIDSRTGKYTMVLKPEQTYYLELIVNQSKYNDVRPHREEFTIPKQCEYYNLYQEISIDYLKDSTGVSYAQRAHFKNAMFDIESEIKKEYGNNLDLSGSATVENSIKGISGHISHNSVLNVQYVELLLLNQGNQVVRMTQTDEFGDFAFEKVDPNQDYILVINEDDAKISQLGDNMGSADEITLEGIVYNFNDKTNNPRPQLKVYLANTKRDISNATISNPNGRFTLSNVPQDANAIANLNSATTISYNLDLSDTEITYSAFITHIDPNNTELAYTEYIDIIELREMSTDPQGGNLGGQDFANLLFDFDKYFLRDKSKDILTALYEYLRDNPTVTIRLEGHTDWFGTPEYNMGLSKDRSLSAHKYLIDKGIAPNRIQNLWFGETKEIVQQNKPDGSDDPEARQLNRRVEIKVEIPEMADIYLSL
ncbi:OmpA family protein [Paracrocinitomix mangrovi]|uniref:OmpA family protein n=1 Tax=Paracrocinitomix mangrovi TaxID=2862509 RepID=UPI001C8E6553|nr:OmpA family protein [Paracrocinitomix mangrovi]UKN03066.1 OmpA family protein [Paracrocinitomix mangrovi]